MAQNSSRPVSPHLQVYKPQISSMLSITHRATGVALAAGALFLVCWLTALAGGAESFAALQGFAGSIIGRLLLLAFTGALNYHLLNGIRHLFWDAGKGFSIPAMNRSGIAVLVGATVLTLGEWAVAYSVMGG